MWPTLDRFRITSALSHPRRLRQLLHHHGGFTMCARTGAAVSTGISVCTRPSRSVRFEADEWNDLVVDDWVMTVASHPCWRPIFIGGWVDPGTGAVFLDVVTIVPTRFRSAALLLGRLASQRCVYDLDRRTTVALR